MTYFQPVAHGAISMGTAHNIWGMGAFSSFGINHHQDGWMESPHFAVAHHISRFSSNDSASNSTPRRAKLFSDSPDEASRPVWNDNLIASAFATYTLEEAMLVMDMSAVTLINRIAYAGRGSRLFPFKFSDDLFIRVFLEADHPGWDEAAPVAKMPGLNSLMNKASRMSSIPYMALQGRIRFARSATLIKYSGIKWPVERPTVTIRRNGIEIELPQDKSVPPRWDGRRKLDRKRVRRQHEALYSDERFAYELKEEYAILMGGNGNENGFISEAIKRRIAAAEGGELHRHVDSIVNAPPTEQPAPKKVMLVEPSNGHYPLGRPKRVSDADLAAVLEKHDGSVPATARELIYTRQGVRARIQRARPGSPLFKFKMGS